MSFEASLARVLDPEGLYWNYPGDDKDDPSQDRLIEVRIDVPNDRASSAQSLMNQNGWQLASQPDEPSDPIQRLYFRKVQSLLPLDRTAMLTTALRAAHDADGKFWSWLDRPEDK
ncbi:MAG: hypothetical protein BVN32_05350 [Proteobacteria bacterium ST_bin14]|nr:MAG: hypothetical protein BVN32_05350 [Proteobacteria bacterium ST_bin14]